MKGPGDLDERSFQQAIEANGGAVVDSDGTPFPSDDFSSYFLKALWLRPTVLGAMRAGQDIGNVVKQLNEFKLKSQNITLAIGLLPDTDIRTLRRTRSRRRYARPPGYGAWTTRRGSGRTALCK